ncbi:MAG: ATP synthase F1 subunit epsilon [Candidatus Magasanikbacteria bacterium]|nr:ATP synthase F1 subunit epsilon [Candidatus Magasanikbacteria bacterium]NCS72270.1 ATP synthase F1 subunit epsilon [Candidatus Magasanikbacteria bacterium]
MIDFKIVTPEGTIYEDQIEKVTIPTQAGEITVYEDHVPLVSILKPGELNIHKEKDAVVNLAVSSGIIEVRENSQVYIIADTAERAADIDIKRAEEAKVRAEELMKQQEYALDVDFARLQGKIEKELVRINVGNKYKNVK